MKSIVLLSGGLDSAVAYHLIEGERISIFFDYGQPNRSRELEATYLIDSRRFHVAIPELFTVDDDVIARNAIFLAHAVNFAARLDADQIVTGLRDGPFVDTQAGFLAGLEGLLGAVAHKDLKFIHPVYYNSKSEVIAKAKEFGIHDLTYSCFRSNTPCGECPTCMEIKRVQVL